MRKALFVIIFVIVAATTSVAQSFRVSGRVIDADASAPVSFSYVSIPELSLWAVADENGVFIFSNVSSGNYTVEVNCLGFEKYSAPIAVSQSIDNLKLKIVPTSLKLNDVVVVAQRRKSEISTSYNVDRLALDNQQILNLSSVASLLPGGKTINDNLVSDSRIALRSASSEKGNASFGTAIEVDGVRMDNNAMMGETMAASTRSIATSDVESVDVISGIPSVQYGDLSNGVVKINLRRGKSPFTLEGRVNPKTSQLSLAKGFELPSSRGLLNLSFEHARSLKDIASPYTSFRRNVLSLRYSNAFLHSTTPLNISLGLTANLGGYNSQQDPDNNLDSYNKASEKLLRLNLEANLLLNKLWLTDLTLKASASLQNRLTENYTNVSSSSSQPYIHVTQSGYNVASTSPDAPVVLGPTGYWYVSEFIDQKPLALNFSLKANRTRRNGHLFSKSLLGADLSLSHNNGRGRYYNDLALAPTWRPYRYDNLPRMSVMALYAEENLSLTIAASHTLSLVLGLRDDITAIPHSAYGTVTSLSPRVSARYTLSNADAIVSDFALHAGWGKSVKMPSFQVLYPQDSYTDILTFTPGSTADNKAYYAYYTYVSKALYNDHLRFQQTQQTDLGVDFSILGAKVSLSAFYNKTLHPYQLVRIYSPLQYNYTSQAALEGIAIPSAQRTYSVDSQTGVVTVSGNGTSFQLPSTQRNTFLYNEQYVNGSPVSRYGLEWIVDVPLLRALSLRLDGNFYRYRGVDESLIAGSPSGIADYAASSPLQPLIGFYRGSSVVSAGATSTPSVSNGSTSTLLSQNVSLTLRIPKARLVMMLKAETTLRNYHRQLSEADGTSRGIALKAPGDVEGTPYNGQDNSYVALYPEFYATWDNPSSLIPFASAFADAKASNPELYAQLARLIVRSNTSYYFNSDSISPYCSFNVLVTKEIGDHFTMSFYANNFLNTMRSVHSTQTGLDSSLFGSAYVPEFYYGLSLKVKI